MGSTQTPQVNTQEKKSGGFLKNLPTDPLIFTTAMGFIVLFVAVTVVLGDTARDAYSAASEWVTSNLGWLFIGGVSVSFIFLIGLFVSRYGRIQLGDDDEEPEYTIAEWFGMLFAGGTGSMLMFWGVAEPLNHAYNPPFGQDPMTREAQNTAMAFTIYHLGIHMWVIMALPGLALGYFIYKRHLPPRVSSIFAPLLGARIYSWPGKLIDAVAIIGTVVGIAVSVGMGALQINSGAARVIGTPENSMVQLILIAIIIVIASISVARGLDKGIKVLSNANIWAAMGLMVFVLLMGPTLTLLRQTVDTAGVYLDALPRVMFWTDSYDVNPNWKQGAWTVFYWAWTICWSPFVGMFIARISRGRTVRQFIAGVIALPTIVSILWFSIFGRAGFELENEQPGILTEPVVEGGDPSPALFILLEQYPLTTLVSVFALFVIMIFFVTSIDSASMVMDMMSTGEENKAPTFYRVLWGIMIGAVAASLLLISGETALEALQSAVIVIGVPFFFLHFIMMYSLVKGMSDDHMAVRKPVTRQWKKTDTPEKLEKHEAAPAPGYDEEGNELPRFEYTHDEDGRLVIQSDVVVEGEFESGEKSESEESEESGTKSES
ncbi:BCCT family transporter [Corynebacterium amycolatum]|uniref:BCCT family transporter n=1 Tax=Corynebacterium amycolatum TaxID=43765 RepID=UPI00211A3BBA|nr:BCCT family transporter [Corynebacterium amycolatum]MCQ9125830.1 BCCT family transporter [Corynebacterium amycolatum]MCQ9169105.1 BCCT family transporter [Corynebacterium amycolatum]MCQ9176304.1 BCCT family transporter [Corynebacterium amycolatum]